MQQAEDILKRYWNYNSFRPLQKDIIQSILDNRDTLALLPTGGGKSICYQVPALINDGFCLVVSPLIALMQDQVSRLTQLDIPAACIHSGMSFAEVRRTLENAMHGVYKLLYVSPERLQTYVFRDFLPQFDLSMVAIDEAHCISQWGHDFRPDYLKIARIKDEFPRVPFLALTATATAEVKENIAAQLRFRDHATFVQSFARTNIFYDIRYSENKPGDVLAHSGDGCAIVYCRSRKQTETVGKYLIQNGIPAAIYHAGMKKDDREQSQERWMTNGASVMAATTAFGMGIDKPDVRTVIHYDAPEHLEAYYQEAGRAGRDGKPSFALGLYNHADIKRLQESTALKYPPEAYLRKVYQSVVEYLQIPIGAEPDKYYSFDLSDFCKKFSLKANEAIHALKLLEQEGLWTLTESVYHPATVQFTIDRHILERFYEAHPAYEYFIVGLLRMYNTIFHFPTAIREFAIAKQLRMKKDDVVDTLAMLHRMEILEYNQPGEGPQMFFHHYRVDSRHLNINNRRIHALRQRHEARTEAMIAFLENSTVCRERLLLSYFGEEASHDCRHCDVCRDKADKNVDRRALRAKLLETIERSQGISLTALTNSYTLAMRVEVVSVLRAMIDEGALEMDGERIICP